MRNRKILYMIIAFLILSITTLTIAYSALSTILKISGASEIQQANWDIHFDNIVVKPGSISSTKTAVISNPQQVDFEVTLYKPGDFFEFNIDIVNKGSIDAMIENIIKTPELTPTQQKYAIYEITYSDGNSVGLKQLLKAQSQKTIRVRVAYKTDLTASDLPQNPDTLNLSFQAIFTQADSSNIVGPEGSGVELPKLVRMVSGDLKNPQIGDMFAIKNERFHIYSSTETTVTGIAEYNLYVGGKYDHPNWIAYGPEATGIQNSEMRAARNDDTKSTYNGAIAFSSEDKKGTSYSDYKGSIVEEHVNNYHNILTSYGVKIEETRLITKDELVNIFNCQGNQYCPETYPWIYYTSYWTQTESSPERVWRISNTKLLYGDGCLQNMFFGVRPVVTILKSEFK